MAYQVLQTNMLHSLRLAVLLYVKRSDYGLEIDFFVLFLLLVLFVAILSTTIMFVWTYKKYFSF